ncbi:hypothetical protein LCGC14_0947310 [marine sediment metagenome]|uniref:Uncharacterized protein n=1 Tax=marine sediment metagenome TaxID=412755 RepID=A0A0F9R1X1_9ZZZZ
MNWKKWMKFNPYKKLWSLIGGRPWTYIRRDFWHRFELVNIVFFVSVGFFSGIFYGNILKWLFSSTWHPILLVAGFYLIGVLQGHFFWGSRYVKGQEAQ